MEEDDLRIADALLDKLYAVALEPERFAELVEAGEHALAGGPTVARSPSWPLFPSGQQAARADSILTVVEATNAQLATLQSRVDAEQQAMLAVDASGGIRAANAAAHRRYGLAEGGRIDELPLPPGSLGELREAVRRLLHRRSADGDDPALLRLERDAPEAPLVVASPAGRPRAASRSCC